MADYQEIQGEELDRHLKNLRNRIAKLDSELCDAIVEACPGIHQPRQHRDRRPPWCKDCGRTRNGVKIKEV